MLTKEELIKSDNITIKLSKGEVVARKLMIGEVVGRKEDDGKELMFDIISLSLTNPVLTYDEAKKLPVELAKELQDKLLEINGMNKEARDELKKSQ